MSQSIETDTHTNKVQLEDNDCIVHWLSKGAAGHAHRKQSKGSPHQLGYLLFECLPLDLLLAEDSDFRSPEPVEFEFFLEDVLEPAFSLPTFKLTFPIVVC